MSYVPPPPAPEQPAREPRQRRELWYGVGVGLFACLVLPFAGLVSPDTLGVLGVGVLTPLVVVVAGVVLVIPDRHPAVGRRAADRFLPRAGRGRRRLRRAARTGPEVPT